jgi:hypothetical protein
MQQKANALPLYWETDVLLATRLDRGIHAESLLSKTGKNLCFVAAHFVPFVSSIEQDKGNIGGF